MLISRTHAELGRERAFDPLADWRPRSARQRIAAAGLGIFAMLAAAALGWVVGGWIGSDAAPPRAPAAQLSRLGELGVEIDGAWTSAPAARSPYATLAGARSFAPVAGAPARVVLGRSDARHRSLIPSAIRAALAEPLPRPVRARLAGRPAWAYPGLRQRDGNMVSLVVAPLTDGNLVLACTASPGLWPIVAGCASGVRSIAGPASVAPSPALAAQRFLPAAIAELNRARRGGAAALRRAHTRRGQAEALRRLARAHAAARRRLAPVLAADSSVTSALARSATAYWALAHAAGHNRRVRYRRARVGAKLANARLRRALARAV